MSESLIKLHRFRVDELRRQLSEMDAMRADLERKARDISASVEAEKLRTRDSDIARVAFPGFARAMDLRRSNIEHTIDELMRVRESLQSELNAAFQELKKHEIVAETRVQRARRAARRRAQAVLDETALVRHQRRRPAGGSGV